MCLCNLLHEKHNQSYYFKVILLIKKQ